MTIIHEKRRHWGPLIAGGLGLFNLAIGLNRPSIADMRTVDLVHLLGTGGCLGVALGGVVLYLVGRRKG